MASKAWDSSLRLQGLIVESRTVIDGIVEMSGRLAAVGGELPRLRDAIDVSPQSIRAHTDGSADQWQHRQVATVGSTVSVHAYALSKAHVQRAVGAAGWPAIWPQGGSLRRASAHGGGRAGW